MPSIVPPLQQPVIPLCAPAAAWSPEGKLRRSPRKKLLQQVLVQLRSQRVVRRYLWRLAFLLVLVAALDGSRGTLDPEAPFLVLAVSATTDKPKSDRVMVVDEGHSFLVRFQTPVELRVPKDNTDATKLANVLLGWLNVRPTKRGNGHTLSLREIASCTQTSASTVRDHKHRFEADGLEGLLHRAIGGKQPHALRKQVQAWLLEDPLQSTSMFARKANEQTIAGRTDWKSEHIAACLSSTDWNQLQSVVIQCIGRNTSTYLVDRLLTINQRLVELVGRVPIELEQDLLHIEELRQTPGVFASVATTLEEKRSASTVIQCRQRLKLLFLRQRLGLAGALECPDCGSTAIVKKEVRSSSMQTSRGRKHTESVRYYCRNAACATKTFTLPSPWRELGAQRAKDIKAEGLQRLIHLRSSLRHAGDSLWKSPYLDHAVLLRWVQREAQELVPWYDVFTPIACKTLVVDEKWVKMGKVWHYVFLAVEPQSGDLVHIAVHTSNGVQSAKTFLAEVRSLGFQPQIIITDLLGGYHDAIKTVFPDCQHVECLFHAERAARKAIRESLGESQEQDELIQRMSQVFRSKNTKALAKAWKELTATESVTPAMLRSLKRYRALMEHSLAVDPPVSTTNAVERVIQEFDRKYEDMQAFCAFHSMQSWCALFQVYYRLRPYRRGYRKGKSPAEVMGYPVANLTWIDYVLGGLPERSDAIAV